MEIRTEYLKSVYYLDKYKLSVRAAEKALRKFRKKQPFDTIAFSGTSGAAFAYPLSLRLNVPLICVRKGKDHFFGTVEGRIDAKRIIIVDDFIDSGTTVKRIKREVKRYSKKNFEFVGIYIYNNTRDKYQVEDITGLTLINA
jgi:adenine/guanine phosphoribosyltransferase-like PRPP-binding protein